MKYSIVVSIYNDGYLVEPLVEEIGKVMREYLKIDRIRDEVELILVNDGSSNGSFENLKAAAEKHGFVRVVDLSRNFGQHIAIACGLHEAKGDIIVRMNADMQDHPTELPKFFRAMEEGNYDLTVGQYEVRESPLFNKLTAFLYFNTFRILTGFSSPQNTSPMRAMSRRFVDAYNLLSEKSRFPQGLDQWLGFDQKLIPIKHRKRDDGRSSYNFWSRLRLGLEGVIYFSDRPLTLIAIGGFACSLVGLLMGVYTVLARVFWADFLPGYASILSVGFVAFGLQLGCIGVVGLYVARTFKETQNRPLYLIKARYGGVTQNLKGAKVEQET